MKTAVIIPSRLQSTRLPNKPLADILGKPMIQHVWERGQAANVGPVIVACCDQEVYDVITNLSGRAIMTDPNLPTGSDRAYEALKKMGESFEAVICLQGDLPTIELDHIRKVLSPLSNPEVEISTLAAPIKDLEEIENPNVVKIAVPLTTNQKQGRALYFSRNKIPANADIYYHHIGIYAYQVQALEKFINLPQGILEVQERLEQLRGLENGMRIEVQVVDTVPLGVDTLDDLEKARDILKAFSS